jgi:hypothetical protein
MADQGAQHGPRLDDEMHDEVEGLIRGAPVDTRSREDLEPEPLDTIMVPVVDPGDEERHHELLERSELARFLRPSALPADADTVIAIARDEGATDAVLAELGRLPRRTSFATVGEIWAALGHEREPRAGRATVDVPAVTPAPAALRARESASPEPHQSVPVALDSSGHSVRELLGFGLGLARGVLELADRALAAVQRGLEPGS